MNRNELLAALGDIATELRAGLHPATAATIEAEAAARIRVARGTSRNRNDRNAPPESWDNGAVIVTIGRARYVLRACFTVIERFAGQVRKMPADFFATGATITRDTRPLAIAAAEAIAKAPRQPKPQPAPQPAPAPAPQPEPKPWPEPRPAPQPQPWPEPPPAPQPEPWTGPQAPASNRSEAARKAMANRDRFAAARKAADTRRARAAGLHSAEPASAPPAPPATPAPPAFPDWVSERLGTRRWIIGPARRGQRALADRVISPIWAAALRDAYARALRA